MEAEQLLQLLIKMGRQYIGIEQMDYIEDVAVERMKKVIDGEQGGISKSVDWQGGGVCIYLELKKLQPSLDRRYQPSENLKRATCHSRRHTRKRLY